MFIQSGSLVGSGRIVVRGVKALSAPRLDQHFCGGHVIHLARPVARNNMLIIQHLCQFSERTGLRIEKAWLYAIWGGILYIRSTYSPVNDNVDNLA